MYMYVEYVCPRALEVMYASSGIFVFTHRQWLFSDTSVDRQGGRVGYCMPLEPSGFISYLICLHSFHGQWQALIRLEVFELRKPGYVCLFSTRVIYVPLDRF